MTVKVEQFTTKNQNPMLCVAKNGTVTYSNEAAEPFLNHWDAEIGDKLPSSIVDLVQRVISRDSPEKIEIKVGEKVFLVVFHPPREQECINISGFDISNQKKPEEKNMNNEEKYQDFYNLIDQAVQIGEIVFDEKGKSIDNIVLYVNLVYEKHYGFSREQVIGRRLTDILPFIDLKRLERYGEVVRTGKKIHIEEYSAALDKWFDVYASPMGGNRFIAGMSTVS